MRRSEYSLLIDAAESSFGRSLSMRDESSSHYHDVIAPPRMSSVDIAPPRYSSVDFAPPRMTSVEGVDPPRLSSANVAPHRMSFTTENYILGGRPSSATEIERAESTEAAHPTISFKLTAQMATYSLWHLLMGISTPDPTAISSEPGDTFDGYLKSAVDWTREVEM